MCTGGNTRLNDFMNQRGNRLLSCSINRNRFPLRGGNTQFGKGTWNRGLFMFGTDEITAWPPPCLWHVAPNAGDASSSPQDIASVHILLEPISSVYSSAAIWLYIPISLKSQARSLSCRTYPGGVWNERWSPQALMTSDSYSWPDGEAVRRRRRAAGRWKNWPCNPVRAARMFEAEPHYATFIYAATNQKVTPLCGLHQEGLIDLWMTGGDQHQMWPVVLSLLVACFCIVVIVFSCFLSVFVWGFLSLPCSFVWEFCPFVAACQHGMLNQFLPRAPHGHVKALNEEKVPNYTFL